MAAFRRWSEGRGTIVDAKIIAAPSSNKDKLKSRDPEMHRTKKGNRRHFGMTGV
jgi:transposase, IS5 family